MALKMGIEERLSYDTTFKEDDFSEKVVGAVLMGLNQKRVTDNEEIGYLKALIQRATEYGKRQSSVNDICL